MIVSIDSNGTFPEDVGNIDINMIQSCGKYTGGPQEYKLSV